jgi:RluA family pseudouridine synthase
VVYDDDDFVVIDKPAGLLTSTTPREKRPTALAILRDWFREARVRIGVVHRLDKDASGLLVFSKNDGAYRSLKLQLKRRTIERVYVALVEGKPNPPGGVIRGDLFELPDGRMVRSRIPGKGEPAVTHFQTLRVVGNRAVLRVTLETGKKHQIRAHLSQRGNPIVGDTMYGGKPSPRGLHLRATRLAFDHPRTGKRMEFEVPCPFLHEQ